MREPKKVIASITMLSWENSIPYKNEERMDGNKHLREYVLISVTAQAQVPAIDGLGSGDQYYIGFETLKVAPLSSSPKMRDAIKSPESHEHTVP